MTEAQYGHNHVINPATGFLENPAFMYDFDSERKLTFIRRFISNGLSLYDTCDELGLSHHTVFKHFQIDQAFKDAVEQAKKEYADRLDGASKRNAMNPKSVIERIFQLKSLFPGRYADVKNTADLTINMVFDGKMLDNVKQRREVVDVQESGNGGEIAP